MASNYTHGHHEAVLRSHRWRSAQNSAAYLLPRLRAGMALLDVGCGPGTITADLAAAVYPGAVTGVDRAADVIAAASRDHRAPNLTFVVGSAMHLDLPDGTFDVVHAHQVLQHLEDPVAALVEMRRVCRPGGTVAVRDGDYAAMAWWPASEGLERWRNIYRTVARHNGGEPDAGRHLVAWARAAGLEDIVPSASAWCFATDEDRAWWAGTWAERTTSSAFAERAVELGIATRAEMEACASAWRVWAGDGDGSFLVVHGEVMATSP